MDIHSYDHHLLQNHLKDDRDHLNYILYESLFYNPVQWLDQQVNMEESSQHQEGTVTSFTAFILCSSVTVILHHNKIPCTIIFVVCIMPDGIEIEMKVQRRFLLYHCNTNHEGIYSIPTYEMSYVLSQKMNHCLILLFANLSQGIAWQLEHFMQRLLIRPASQLAMLYLTVYVTFCTTVLVKDAWTGPET